MAPSMSLVAALLVVSKGNPDETSMLQMPIVAQSLDASEECEGRCPGYLRADCESAWAQAEGCRWQGSVDSNEPWCQCLAAPTPTESAPTTEPTTTTTSTTTTTTTHPLPWTTTLGTGFYRVYQGSNFLANHNNRAVTRALASDRSQYWYLTHRKGEVYDVQRIVNKHSDEEEDRVDRYLTASQTAGEWRVTTEQDETHNPDTWRFHLVGDAFTISNKPSETDPRLFLGVSNGQIVTSEEREEEWKLFALLDGEEEEAIRLMDMGETGRNAFEDPEDPEDPNAKQHLDQFGDCPDIGSWIRGSCGDHD